MKPKKVGRPGPAFGTDARIRVVPTEPYQCPECRRRTGHKMDCGRRGAAAPHVVKTVAGWAEHERVSAQDYFDEAMILGYPVKSLSSPVPKHWHDDIKIKFREARRG